MPDGKGYYMNREEYSEGEQKKYFDDEIFFSVLHRTQEGLESTKCIRKKIGTVPDTSDFLF